MAQGHPSVMWPYAVGQVETHFTFSAHTHYKAGSLHNESWLLRLFTSGFSPGAQVSHVTAGKQHFLLYFVLQATQKPPGQQGLVPPHSLLAFSSLCPDTFLVFLFINT